MHKTERLQVALYCFGNYWKRYNQYTNMIMMFTLMFDVSFCLNWFWIWKWKYIDKYWYTYSIIYFPVVKNHLEFIFLCSPITWNYFPVVTDHSAFIFLWSPTTQNLFSCGHQPPGIYFPVANNHLKFISPLINNYLEFIFLWKTPTQNFFPMVNNHPKI